MHGEWERAASELLAEGGHRRPVRSAWELARDLGIDVVDGERHVAAQLVAGPPPLAPFIRIDERLARAQLEERVAVELGRYALMRAGYGKASEFRARQVAERMIVRGPRLVRTGRPVSAAACGAGFPSG